MKYVFSWRGKGGRKCWGPIISSQIQTKLYLPNLGRKYRMENNDKSSLFFLTILPLACSFFFFFLTFSLLLFLCLFLMLSHFFFSLLSSSVLICDYSCQFWVLNFLCFLFFIKFYLKKMKASFIEFHTQNFNKNIT